MRLLIVYCHPDPESFAAAVFATVRDTLAAAGHELRCIDLYAEGFDPVMSLAERRSYLVDTEANIAALAPHVQALQWAEGWIAVYPTWYYGLPAMLKGWLDRVWLPGVTFEVASAKQRTIRGRLVNIRRFVGITTSGSPWWWLKVIGDPGRSLLMKGLRPLYARGCRMQWLQLFDMNHATATDRERFLARVRRTLEAIR
jgi:putative NADPH-quinone reductase